MRNLLLAVATAATFVAPSSVPAAMAGQEQLGQSNPPPSDSGEGRDCQRKKQEQVTS
ncbi:hypothetical protein KEU06_20995 [Pseudaminobacter sp. 19-2017]|uniref:Uncharacterized protein n=1 Tax=Pseudaminobacter soli (ex Zhang et al. 2022) TaxID=2831468 RepID=A0A942I3Y9_9HYPH|nr:hypothetical protein [Pseudaminobacter soli]MBS3651093.1 hypothetical protein [Pseudaminobacter soli]